MRSLSQLTDDELREAHSAADLLCSEKFRFYLPGRMLPMLLGRFRDDMAEATGMEPLPLPQRAGSVKAARLDDLTSAELDALSAAVLTLVMRFTAIMDDPLLPRLLSEFRDALEIEKGDRARIANELRDKARAS